MRTSIMLGVTGCVNEATGRTATRVSRSMSPHTLISTSRGGVGHVSEVIGKMAPSASLSMCQRTRISTPMEMIGIVSEGTERLLVRVPH